MEVMEALAPFCSLLDRLFNYGEINCSENRYPERWKRFIGRAIQAVSLQAVALRCEYRAEQYSAIRLDGL